MHFKTEYLGKSSRVRNKNVFCYDRLSWKVSRRERQAIGLKDRRKSDSILVKKKDLHRYFNYTNPMVAINGSFDYVYKETSEKARFLVPKPSSNTHETSRRFIPVVPRYNPSYKFQPPGNKDSWYKPHYKSHPGRNRHLDDIFLPNHNDDIYDTRKGYHRSYSRTLLQTDKTEPAVCTANKTIGLKVSEKSHSEKLLGQETAVNKGNEKVNKSTNLSNHLMTRSNEGDSESLIYKTNLIPAVEKLCSNKTNIETQKVNQSKNSDISSSINEMTPTSSFSDNSKEIILKRENSLLVKKSHTNCILDKSFINETEVNKAEKGIILTVDENTTAVPNSNGRQEIDKLKHKYQTFNAHDKDAQQPENCLENIENSQPETRKLANLQINLTDLFSKYLEKYGQKENPIISQELTDNVNQIQANMHSETQENEAIQTLITAEASTFRKENSVECVQNKTLNYNNLELHRPQFGKLRKFNLLKNENIYENSGYLNYDEKMSSTVGNKNQNLSQQEKVRSVISSSKSWKEDVSNKEKVKNNTRQKNGEISNRKGNNSSKKRNGDTRNKDSEYKISENICTDRPIQSNSAPDNEVKSSPKVLNADCNSVKVPNEKNANRISITLNSNTGISFDRYDLNTPRINRSRCRYKSESYCDLRDSKTDRMFIRKSKSINDISYITPINLQFDRMVKPVKGSQKVAQLKKKATSDATDYKDELLSLFSSRYDKDVNIKSPIKETVRNNLKIINNKNNICKSKRKRSDSLEDQHAMPKKLPVLVQMQGKSKEQKKNQNTKQRLSNEKQDQNKDVNITKISTPNGHKLDVKQCSVSSTSQSQTKHIIKAECVKSLGRKKSPVNIYLSIETSPKSANIKQRRATFTCEADNKYVVQKMNKGRFKNKVLDLFGDSSEDEDELIRNKTEQEQKKKEHKNNNFPSSEASQNLENIHKLSHKNAKKCGSDKEKLKKVKECSGRIKDSEISSNDTSRKKKQSNKCNEAIANNTRIYKEVIVKVAKLNEKQHRSKPRTKQCLKDQFRGLSVRNKLHSILSNDNGKSKHGPKKKKKKEQPSEDLKYKLKLLPRDHKKMSPSTKRRKSEKLSDKAALDPDKSTIDNEVKKNNKKQIVTKSNKNCKRHIDTNSSHSSSTINTDSQVTNTVQNKFSSDTFEKLIEVNRRNSAPSILNHKNVALPLICRETPGEINGDFEKCDVFSPIKPISNKITSATTVVNECVHRVCTYNNINIQNDSVTVHQITNQRHNGVTEITPITDLTEDDERERDDHSPEKTLADLLFETKQEIQKIAEEGELITLYRSDEAVSDTGDIQAMSASISLKQTGVKVASNKSTSCMNASSLEQTAEQQNSVIIVNNRLQGEKSDSLNVLNKYRQQNELVNENSQPTYISTPLSIANHGSSTITSPNVNIEPVESDYASIQPNTHSSSIKPSSSLTDSTRIILTPTNEGQLIPQTLLSKAQISVPMASTEPIHQQNNQLPLPNLVNINSDFRATVQKNVSSVLPQNNSNNDVLIIDLTGTDCELSFIDMRLIVEIFTRHAYFLAHLCHAQKVYVESLCEVPLYKHYFKAEIELFENQKQIRLVNESLQLWREIKALDIKASRNLNRAVALIMELVTVNLRTKNIPKRVTKSIIYLLLGELMKPQMEMYATIPLFKTLIDHIGYVTCKMYSKSLGPFTEETRRILKKQIEKYNGLCKNSIVSHHKHVMTPQSNRPRTVLSNNRQSLDFVHPNTNTISNINQMPTNNQQCQRANCGNASRVSSLKRQEDRAEHLTSLTGSLPDKTLRHDNTTKPVPGYEGSRNMILPNSFHLPSSNLPIHHSQTLSNFTTRTFSGNRSHLQPSLYSDHFIKQPQGGLTHPRLSNPFVKSTTINQPEQQNIQRLNLPRHASNSSLIYSPTQVTNYYGIHSQTSVWTPSTRLGYPVQNSQHMLTPVVHNSALEQANIQFTKNATTNYQRSSENQNPEEISQSNSALSSNSRIIMCDSNSNHNTVLNYPRCRSNINEINNLQSFLRHEEVSNSISSHFEQSNSSTLPTPNEDDRSRHILSSSETRTVFTKPVNENFKIKLPFTKPNTPPVTTNVGTPIYQGSTTISLETRYATSLEINSTKYQDQIALVNNTTASNNYVVNQPQTSSVLNQGLEALSLIGQPSKMLQLNTNLPQTQTTQRTSAGTNITNPNPHQEVTLNSEAQFEVRDPPQNKSQVKQQQSQQTQSSIKDNLISSQNMSQEFNGQIPTKSMSVYKKRRLIKEIEKDYKKIKMSESDEIIEIIHDEMQTEYAESRVNSNEIAEREHTVEGSETEKLHIENQNCNNSKPISRRDSTDRIENQSVQLSHTKTKPNSNVQMSDDSSVTKIVNLLETHVSAKEHGMETIDLTWIDDMDETELKDEMDFVFVKQENGENQTENDCNNKVNEENTTYTLVQSLCICGEIANYNCACGDAWYCGQQCQLHDWECHQLYHTPEETDTVQGLAPSQLNGSQPDVT